MKFIEEKQFDGGLNSDDEDRKLPVNDYRLALNVRNGSSDTDNIGAPENVKGNLLAPFELPQGKNTTIRSFEDKENITVIDFIHNDLGNHTIRQYFPDTQQFELILTDPLLNFSLEHLITSVDLIGDKLYFNDDFNPPRKLNIAKAKNNKAVEYSLYFDIPLNGTVFEFNTEYQIKVIDHGISGIPSIFTTTVYRATQEAEGDLEVGSKEFAADFNIIDPINKIFTAEACGRFVKITATVDRFIEIEFTAITANVIAVPQNFYSFPLVEEVINAAKGPPHCEPDVTILRDETRESNHVSTRVFAFRAKYVFDDDESSTLGPISLIPFDEISCVPQLTDAKLNAIDIDFTDVRLNELASLNIIKKVTLYVRERNDGKWKLIKTLEQSDFGIGKNVFRFFNDGITTVISDREGAKLFDSHPILARTQELAKNRLWYGNCLEGKDPVCIDAELKTEYAEPVANELFSITGKIFIINPFLTNDKYWPNQPITESESSIVEWGGFGDDDVVGDVGDKYGQILPLRGFLTYLAGTDHFAISKQNDPNPVKADHDFLFIHTDHAHNITLLDNNVYKHVTKGPVLEDFTVTPGFSLLFPCDVDKDRQKIRCAMIEGRVFSTFEIKNVPPGKYVLRVAGHKTTRAELDDPSRLYQRSSTNTIEFNGLAATEIVINVTTANIDIGEISIMDLSNPKLLEQSTALTGYLTDKDVTQPTNPNEISLKSDTRIELATVIFETSLNWIGGLVNLITGHQAVAILRILWEDADRPRTFTDHNGYWFYSRNATITSFVESTIRDAEVLNNACTATQFNIDGTLFSKVSGSKGVEVILRNTSATVSDFTRTKLVLKVLDPDGLGKPGISLLTTRGGFTISDANGDAALTVYGDSIAKESTGLNRRADTAIYAVTDANCIFEFDPTSEVYDIQIDQNAHNFTTFFSLQDVIATQIVASVVNAFKRGGIWDIGLVYYDFANRSGTVNVSDKLKLIIPFYSEIDPKTGIINPAGIPTVFWEINHDPPDDGSTHYQWVRTKNNFNNNYLQWIVKEALFVDDTNNQVTFDLATKIEINIGGIGEYAIKFPNVKLDLLPEAGWKVRFMYDKAGNFFDKYIDVEILQFVSPFIVIYKIQDLAGIAEGTVLEFYNPKLQVEEKIYHEFGECFDIGTRDDGTKFHKGSPLLPENDQNQSIGKPATGTFKSGDAWYRIRSFPTDTGTRRLFIDDDSISDFYVSQDSSIGRINVEDPDFARLRRETLIRFSNKIFPESKINGLSTFDALDNEDLPKENGIISHFQMTENVLLSIHGRRTTSIYIDERMITSLDGQDTITKTDATIGATRTLRGRFGTIHPESVTEHKGMVYNWDVNKGEWIRYSVNGLFPISDYKMSNYFADKAKEMLSLKDPSRARVFSTYDSFFDELIVSMPKIISLEGKFNLGPKGIELFGVTASFDTVVFESGTNMSPFVVGELVDLSYFDIVVGETVINSFKILAVEDFYINIDTTEIVIQFSLRENDKMVAEVIDETKRETLAFSERRTRWTTFYSYQPEYLGKTGIDIISYRDGDLYRHNVNETRNNFYGEQFNSEMEFIVNGNPSKVQSFTAISIEANKVWFIPEKGIVVPANSQIPNGMASRLSKSRFRLKEGLFYAELLRDTGSPGFTDPDQALINGRLLRGQTCNVKIVNDDTDLVVLYAANVISIPSELSKSSA